MAGADVLRVAMRATSLTLAEVVSRDVEDLARGPGLLVDPTVEVHGFLEVDPGRIAIDVDLGRMVAAERVAAIGGLDVERDCKIGPGHGCAGLLVGTHAPAFASNVEHAPQSQRRSSSRRAYTAQSFE